MSIRLILVDDHAVVREGLCALLNLEPDLKVVGSTGTAPEALSLVDQLKPDVVVMDLQLGEGWNGIDATRELLSLHPALGVVVLSMYDDVDLVFQVLEAGASGYVLKRAGVEELVKAIRLAKEGQAYLDPQITRRVIDGLQEKRPLVKGAEEEVPELTDRELEVLRLIAEGLTNSEIARRLVISIKTVQTHRSNIMQKLNLHDRVGLVKYAIKKGILKLN